MTLQLLIPLVDFPTSSLMQIFIKLSFWRLLKAQFFLETLMTYSSSYILRSVITFLWKIRNLSLKASEQILQISMNSLFAKSIDRQSFRNLSACVSFPCLPIYFCVQVTVHKLWDIFTIFSTQVCFGSTTVGIQKGFGPEHLYDFSPYTAPIWKIQLFEKDSEKDLWMKIG